jgi:outer membrane receptor protein involved in Fe transport
MAQELPEPGEGIIAGSVASAVDGNPIADAQVNVSDSNVSARTDAQGKFRLVLPAGTWQLNVSGAGYSSATLSDVVVLAGQTVDTNVTMQAAPGTAPGGDVEQLLVLGRAVLEGSVASSLAQQQEATSVTEVIGSEEFTRLGDSTAADTLNRLTGLNVEEGKFVVIRGQPLRYTSTLFNGSQMPSLDPVQSVTPLDLFPSGVLSNIAVQKTFSADRPGSFGSGQIQLSTTGLPIEDFLEIKAGAAVNFQSIDDKPLEFNTGEDHWGDVEEILQLPAAVEAAQNAGIPIATLPLADRIALAQSFSDELAPGYMNAAGPDGSGSVTGGKRWDTGFGTYGASLAFDYGQNVRTEREQRKLLRLASGNEVIVRDESVIDRTKFSTVFGGLLALTGEWEDHEVKSNTFWVRDTLEQTELNEGVFRPSDEDYLRKFLLEYEKRELFIQQFTGRHDFEYFYLGWRGLLSEANRDLPDRREFALNNTELDGSGFWFVENVPLDRHWNLVDESTWSAGADVSFDLTRMFFDAADLNILLQGGVDRELRDRKSDTRLFQFVANPSGGNRFQPVEQLFADDRVASGEVTMSENAAADDYLAKVGIDGSYVQTDIEMPERFRLVLGVRFEQAEFDVTTYQFAGAAGAVPVKSGFLKRDELPSLVGSWYINDELQLRAGVARSLAYPTPIELADTTFIDPDSNELFLGNPDLKPVIIDSYDVRLEWYPSRAEALTLGFFYKDMTDPIERFSINRSGASNAVVEFTSAQQGEVIGVELNSRFGLGRIRDVLDYFGESYEWLPAWVDDMHIGGNFAYLDSEVTAAAGGIDTNPVRRMTGQPKMTANLEWGYTGTEHVIRIAAGYTSDRLINAGVNGLPDEFIEPRFTLGGKWSYNPGFLDPLTVSLELENLLDDEYARTQGPFFTRSYTTGITGSLSFKWRFDYE